MAHPTRSWIVRTNQPIIIPLIGLSILSLLSSLTAIFFAFFSKNTIDSAVNQDMGLLARSAWILALLLFFQVFLSVLSNLYKTYVIGQSKLRLQTRLFERFLRLSLKDSSKHHTGYLMNHLESDLKEIAEGSFDLLPRLIYYLSRFFWRFYLFIHFRFPFSFRFTPFGSCPLFDESTFRSRNQEKASPLSRSGILCQSGDERIA